MAKSNDLTAEAIAGYRNCINPSYATSACWYAHELGAFFQRTGRPEPKDVRMSRGSQIHANGMLFAFDDSNTITRIR